MLLILVIRVMVALLWGLQGPSLVRMFLRITSLLIMSLALFLLSPLIRNTRYSEL